MESDAAPLLVDVERIRQRLFDDRKVRARLVRDYGLSEPSTPDELARSLVASFRQLPVAEPLNRPVDNAEVFRAAVRALASNSRSWATFLGSEGKLESLLHDYDPVKTHRDFQSGHLSDSDVASCLPGQTMTGDSEAIRKWAQLLSNDELYYPRIQGLGRAIQQVSKTQCGSTIGYAELMMCIVGGMGEAPPKRWRCGAFLPEHLHHFTPEEWKLPGMGYVLGSEFLRNLGWSGFKPDRHVQRLFDLWCPELLQEVRQRSIELQGLLGTRRKPFAEYLQYSLVGLQVTPKECTHSQVDNLVWSLGAYVEKMGKESRTCYVKPRDRG